MSSSFQHFSASVPLMPLSTDTETGSPFIFIFFHLGLSFFLILFLKRQKHRLCFTTIMSSLRSTCLLRSPSPPSPFSSVSSLLQCHSNSDLFLSSDPCFYFYVLFQISLSLLFFLIFIYLDIKCCLLSS